MRDLLKIIIINILKIYKYFLSPFLPQSCRFFPTCSVYSMEAIQKYGIFKGCYLAIRRLIKCHPFHPGGYDPLK